MIAMTINDIPAFPSNSKVWVYQADRNLHDNEQFEINQLLSSFTKQWTAHNQDLSAWGGILYNRFIVLMVDESKAQASGCSIDSSVHFLKELEGRYNINLFDRLHLAYFNGDQINTVHRSEIDDLLESGELTPETIVFNNMITDKKGLDEKWMVPLKRSWAGSKVGAS